MMTVRRLAWSLACAATVLVVRGTAGAQDGGLPVEPPAPLLAGQIVVGVSNRIEWLDPNDGQAIHKKTPIPLPSFGWMRLIHQGEFVLAEGVTRDFQTRGLALLRRNGQVLWTRTHAWNYGNGLSHHIFLGVDGTAAFHTQEGGTVVSPAGAETSTGRLVPMGPPTHGKVPLQTLARLSDDGPPAKPKWLALDRGSIDDRAPDLTADEVVVLPQEEWTRIRLVRALKTHAQQPLQLLDLRPIALESIASLPLPRPCEGFWLERTGSPRYFRGGCSGSRRHEALLLDVKAKRLVRMKIPDENQAPPEGVSANVDREGTVFATVATGCSASLYSASRSLKWTKVRDFERDVPLEIYPVCNHLTLRPQLHPSNFPICVGSHEKDNGWITIYVQQQDGTWLPLPYDVFNLQGGCSPDGHSVVMGLEKKTKIVLSIARLDRNAQRVVEFDVKPAGGLLGSVLPAVWIP